LLAQSTIKGAAVLATGQGVVSESVTALVERTLSSMTINKIRAAIVLFLALAVCGFGVGAYLHAFGDRSDVETPKVGEAKNVGGPSADWPLFRGNALQTGVSKAKLPDKLEVLWKFETKEAIESTAAIANGVAYVGSFDEHLYAIELASGKEKWKFK